MQNQTQKPTSPVASTQAAASGAKEQPKKLSFFARIFGKKKNKTNVGKPISTQRTDKQGKTNLQGNTFTALFPDHAKKEKQSIIDIIVEQSAQEREKKGILDQAPGNRDLNREEKEVKTIEKFLYFSKTALSIAVFLAAISFTYFYIQLNNTSFFLHNPPYWDINNIGRRLADIKTEAGTVSKEIAEVDKNIKQLEANKAKIGGVDIVQKIQENKIIWTDIIGDIEEITEEIVPANKARKVITYSGYSGTTKENKINITGKVKTRPVYLGYDEFNRPRGGLFSFLIDLIDAFESHPNFHGVNYRTFSKKSDKENNYDESSLSLNFFYEKGAKKPSVISIKEKKQLKGSARIKSSIKTKAEKNN